MQTERLHLAVQCVLLAAHLLQQRQSVTPAFTVLKLHMLVVLHQQCIPLHK